MAEINDGGPAFPVQGSPKYDDRNGLSLRDWFAGRALAGLLAFPGTLEGNSTKFADVASTTAYKMADAMIKERAK